MLQIPKEDNKSHTSINAPNSHKALTINDITDSVLIKRWSSSRRATPPMANNEATAVNKVVVKMRQSTGPDRAAMIPMRAQTEKRLMDIYNKNWRICDNWFVCFMSLLYHNAYVIAWPESSASAAQPPEHGAHVSSTYQLSPFHHQR